MADSNEQPRSFKQPSLGKQLSFAERLTQNAHTNSALSTITEPVGDYSTPTTINSIQLTAVAVNNCNDYMPNNNTSTLTAVSRPDNGYHNNITSTSTQIDFNVINTDDNDNNIDLYIILYYFLRFFSVMVTLFLAIMAINYAIGQVFSLSVADLFCPDYDEDTIREYNLKNDYPTGSVYGGNCNKIHRPEIDENKVRFGDPYVPVLTFGSVNVLACIAFSLLATCLAVLGLYHLYTCFYDGFYHFIKKDAANNPRIIKAANSNRKRSKNTIVLLYKKWNMFLFKHYYPDSQLRIISMILSEIFEILMQCWALLIYGGVQSVSFSFVIANESIFVKSFAMILGLNAILAGILWLLYVIKFNKEMKCIKIDLNTLFHGTAFQSIVFVIDMIFDFVYTIFPFTLYKNKENSSLLFNIKALATLNSENPILFLAAFIAMVLLFHKCYNVLISFDPVQIEYRTRKIINNNIELMPYLQMEYIPQSNTTNITDNKTWKWQQLKRRLCIGSIGILFLIFGITIIITVNKYISNAYEICSNPSEKLLISHPELYYWNDYCSSKLTPFDSSSTPCDCRVLDIIFTPKHYNEYNFTQQHIISIMSNFKMITFLVLELNIELILIGDHMTANGQLQLTKELFYINLTKECFVSEKLNSLNLYRLHLTDLNWNALSDLNDLQVLEIHGAKWENPINWDSIGSLTNLKYLNLRESAHFLSGSVSDAICNLKQLRYLDLQTNFISRIPNCIGDLTQLYGVNFRGLALLEYITPNLFRLPNIVSIVGYFAGLINSSSIPNDGKWGKSLKTVFLQKNPICNQLNTLTVLQMEFVNHFKVCFSNMQCPETADCSTYDWGDGTCDTECCHFDGGDCHQTCECDKSLWFNNACDMECNTTKCAYDFGDCLPLVISNATEPEQCVNNSGCYSEWQDDGWCDNNCFALNENEECGDIYDCDIENQCDDDSECSIPYLYIIHTAASSHEPKELIDINEACSFWDYLIIFDSELKNCTYEFPKIDLNNDGYVSFWEGLQMGASFFSLTPEKAWQVNCSLCLQNPSLYY